MSKENIYNLDYGSFVGSQKGFQGFKNNLRLKIFMDFIDPCAGEKILEVGCNDGFILSHVSRFCQDVYGIDINEEMVRRLNNERIRVMSAARLEFQNNFFDKVYALDVIEHVPQIKEVFREAHRVLKPGGKFIISYPLETIRGQAALWSAVMVYKNPFYARRLHVHKLNPKKIREIIQDISLDIMQISMKFTPVLSHIMTLKKTSL